MDNNNVHTIITNNNIPMASPLLPLSLLSLSVPSIDKIFKITGDQQGSYIIYKCHIATNCEKKGWLKLTHVGKENLGKSNGCLHFNCIIFLHKSINLRFCA